MKKLNTEHLNSENTFKTSGVAALSAGHATHDTYTGFLPALLPLFIKYLFLTKTEAGLLSVFTQAPSLVQPVIGHMADKKNLYKIVFFTPAIAAVLMSLTSMASNFWILALILVLVGFNSSAIHAVGPVITGKLSGNNLGKGMSFWMVGGELGRTLGPVIVVSAVHIAGFKNIYWLMFAGIAMSVFLYARFKKLTIEHVKHPDSLPLKKALLQMRRIMIPLSVFLFIRSFMMVSITTFLPIYLTERGEGLFFAGAALSILEAAGMAGALSGGSLSDKLGRRVVLFSSAVSASLLMLIFTLSKGIFMLPVLLLLGFAAFSITPVIMALVQESFPANRALANGVYMAASFVLRSVVVVVVGVLGDRLGLQTAYFVSSAAMAAGIIVIFFLPKK
ncbi:MFS transporter [candidate division KSB1 bacterium]|nr:MAG: MFS transporter [candidate division KSB1 bacterium]